MSGKFDQTALWYFWLDNGARQGPVTGQLLQQMAHAGLITSQDHLASTESDTPQPASRLLHFPRELSNAQKENPFALGTQLDDSPAPIQKPTAPENQLLEKIVEARSLVSGLAFIATILCILLFAPSFLLSLVARNDTIAAQVYAFLSFLGIIFYGSYSRWVHLGSDQLATLQDRFTRKNFEAFLETDSASWLFSFATFLITPILAFLTLLLVFWTVGID